MDKTLVKALVAVIFTGLGLLIVVVLVGLITKQLDVTGTVLALCGIVSGTVTALVVKGGGDQ